MPAPRNHHSLTPAEANALANFLEANDIRAPKALQGGLLSDIASLFRDIAEGDEIIIGCDDTEE